MEDNIKYYFVGEALTLDEKGYKEYAMYLGKHYARARIQNDSKLVELYFADDIIENLQLVGITENEVDYYKVSPAEDWKIYREDGMTYVYVEEGLMREQDSRIYRPKVINQYDLPDIIYKVYEELWKEPALEEFRTDFYMCIRNINVEQIQKFIKKLNETNEDERYQSKCRVVRKLCQDPPAR